MPTFALKEAFNQYFDQGCCTFTKHEVLAYGAGDRQRIAACLVEWESKNLLQLLKPLEAAADSDKIVQVLKVIE